MRNYYSNGKLLLTAEYVVLDGAKALAVPTKKGQNLEISAIQERKLIWESYNSLGKLWFSCEFELDGIFENKNPLPDPVAERLRQILAVAHGLNPHVLEKSGYKAISRLEFPNNWGLGSSSTLINNIAQWFGVDPFFILEKSFGGSGYDIACAQNDFPITYQLPQRKIKPAKFDPKFQNELFFVHLNQKQDSREAIKNYRTVAPKEKRDAIEKISSLTDDFITCKDIFHFEKLLVQHETIISSLLRQPTVKERLFKDYPRSIKSLGGWGGDFVMATGTATDKHYFQTKGYHCILDYKEMLL